MSECSHCGDVFALADKGAVPMKALAVIQHTAGEYLGLMEDHLEGRRIRFQYFRPFASGGKLPGADLAPDGLILLGGGPWGAAGTRNAPTLEQEIELVRARLDEGIPVIGIGLGSQILALAAGGTVRSSALLFEIGAVARTSDDALNGFLPERYPQAVYMRDWPVPPAQARILAEDMAGRPALFQVGSNSFGFTGHPGVKVGMIEDLIMGFDEVADDAAAGLERLRAAQTAIEDALVPIMTGLVQCTALMEPRQTRSKEAGELYRHVI